MPVTCIRPFFVFWYQHEVTIGAKIVSRANNHVDRNGSELERMMVDGADNSGAPGQMTTSGINPFLMRLDRSSLCLEEPRLQC